jgi:exodeoxyribonuclease V alpha subunit
MEFTGTLEKIIYQKDSFVILSLDAPGVPGAKENGQIKAKGQMLSPTIGMDYRLTGEIETSPRYGDTFVFDSHEMRLPQSRNAVLSYLYENCDGIGPVTAEKILALYGGEALTVCKNDPERVAREVPRLGKKALAIAAGLLNLEKSEAATLDLKSITEGCYISKRMISEIIRQWGTSATTKIRENPYALTQFSGIGFLRADMVARRAGFDLNSPFRIAAGVTHVLGESAYGAGHTYVCMGDLLAQAVELLSISGEAIEAECEKMIAKKDIIRDEKGVSLWDFYEKEKEIAQKLCDLQAAETTLPATAGQIRMNDLADDQRAAVSAAICRRVFILTGAPGTGKTYTIRRIIEAFSGLRVSVAAPTGKAAARAAELTEHPATTIHRLLEPEHCDGKFFFRRDQNNPLDCQICIIDEASMIDVSLFHALVVALPRAARLILVGDTNQLPPVGPGSVLRDMIAAHVPSVELKTIKRQHPGLIVQNCHAIKDGRMISCDNSRAIDFFLSNMDEPAKIRETILSLFAAGGARLRKRFPKIGLRPAGERDIDILSDVQVLSPVREKTDLSCKALNAALQGIINIDHKPADTAPTGGDKQDKFWIGDKVIQTKNDYDKNVVNGDVGTVQLIGKSKVFVKFENPNRVADFPRYANDLDLAYALTVHKYQGSECPIVIIPVHRCFGPLILQRNWIYTAISRASQVVILIGQAEEIRKTIGRTNYTRRLTRLEDFLREEMR